MRIWKDLKFTLRGLRKNPVIAGAAVLSLALGLGANTAIFSLLDALFLRPASVKEPERLVSVHHKGLEGQGTSSTYADYLDLRRDVDAFSGLVAESRRGGLLKVDNTAELVTVTVVSDNYFPVLGVKMALGRALDAQLDAELTGEPPLVIGHQLWRRQFGSDPGIIGSTIILNQGHYTVVGVVTPTFRGFNRTVANDIWVPSQTWAAMSGGSRIEFESRRLSNFTLTGRLAPGASLEQAQVQLETIARRLEEAYPDTNRGRRFVAQMMHAENVRRGMGLSVLMMPVVGLVLLIACVNVANLLLAKAELSRRVTTIQLALGATRAGLIRQFLTESALLAILGLISGVLLANWLLSLAPAMMPPSPIPLVFDVRLDARVLAYAGMLSLLTVFLFGLAPALRASKPDLSSTLKGEELRLGRARTRLSLRNLLVIGQIALSVMLLATAGHLIESVRDSQNIPLGFDQQKNLLTVWLSRDRDADAAWALSELAAEVGAIPGVNSVTYARRMHLSTSGGGARTTLVVPGMELAPDQERIAIPYNQVAPNYFETMGTRLIRGRVFDRRDHRDASKVVIVSETTAARYWPNADPIGRSVQLRGETWQIVGVVEDSKFNHIHESAQPYVYFPYEQWPASDNTLIVDVMGDTAAVTTQIRRRLSSSGIPLMLLGIMTAEEHIDNALYATRMPAQIATGIALLGILLAGVGLYGVVSYGVARQTREFGIRLALGSQRGQILRMTLNRGVRLAAVGAAIGVPLAAALSYWLASQIPGYVPDRVLPFVASVAFVVVVALLSTWLPAWRASRVEASAALRYE